MSTLATPRGFSHELRRLREARRVSQLELALRLRYDEGERARREHGSASGSLPPGLVVAAAGGSVSVL